MRTHARRFVVLASAAAPLVASWMVGAPAPTARPGMLPLREREFTSGGAWSWFGDPRAVYHEGTYRRTYTGWVAPDGSIQVASYDHDSGRRVIVTLKRRLRSTTTTTLPSWCGRTAG